MVTMIINIFLIVSLFYPISGTTWSKSAGCPVSCICREEYFSDLPIARYTKHSAYHQEYLSTDYHATNDVLYDDDDIKIEEENALIKVATCFIQTEIDVEKFILNLPKSIQALSLIKSSGNKTLRTSYLEHFDNLIIFECQGSDPITDESFANDFIIEIDKPLLSLKYLNFDQTRLINSKLREIKRLVSENENNKPESEMEILPYYKYKEMQKNLEVPILTEFSNLILIRIQGCNLQNIYWEIFDGLSNLKYLIIENNNLRFIPNFVFYGTPNLNTLSLAWNKLLNIQITDLAGLLELEYLDLSHNNFSQLSELSFPPFPKLKVADFRDNPITIIFPNTFDIMNTTDSIVFGSEEIKLQLLPNSFLGLNKLIKMVINNVDVPVLNQEMLTGMPILQELILTGNINKIQYDAFLEVRKLEKLILSNCNIYNISMDAFFGLDNLIVLDLSRNKLTFLPPKIFDEQTKLKELILSENKLTNLPSGIFDKIPVKLLRLNENPWHCSCTMADWNPMVINKIKQKTFTSCDAQHDKGIGCEYKKKYVYRYENRMAPKCNSPNKFKDLSVFQAIKKYLQCEVNKIKYKKKIIPKTIINELQTQKSIIKEQSKNINKANEYNSLKNIQIQENREINELLVNNPFYFGLPNSNKYEINNKKLYKKKKQMFSKKRFNQDINIID